MQHTGSEGNPVLPKQPRDTSAPGYCVQSGGSVKYEEIADVKYVFSEGMMTVTVTVNIKNPTGCGGETWCHEYKNGDEGLRVWIDTDGNKIFEPDECVINTFQAAETSDGQLVFEKTFAISSALSETQMRVNLFWEDAFLDPDLDIETDPYEECTEAGCGCDPVWDWGDRRDIAVTFSPDTGTEDSSAVLEDMHAEDCYDKENIVYKTRGDLTDIVLALSDGGTPGQNVTAEVSVPQGWEFVKAYRRDDSAGTNYAEIPDVIHLGDGSRRFPLEISGSMQAGMRFRIPESAGLSLSQPGFLRRAAR